ncbi:hypothetical protein EAE96_009572 [Botrytis aclada]|nr:hypothetical protein EAE96_009572 [Botrytis aclada]
MPSIAESGLNQRTPTELTSTSAVPPTTFLRFSDLAMELRIKIWRYSFPSPQHLILSQYSFTRPLSSPFQNIPPTSFRADDNLPTAFVNRESRTETLKHYHALYQALYRYQSRTPSSDTQAEESKSNDDFPSGATDLLLPHVMYFNPKVDSLAFVYPEFVTGPSEIHAMFPLYNQEAARCLESIHEVKVYHVRLEESEFRHRIMNHGLFKMINCFKSLQRIVLILHPDEKAQAEDLLLHREWTNIRTEKYWTGQEKLEIVYGKEDPSGVFGEIK